jgi:hypothetical protein
MLPGACAELVGTLIHQFALGKDIGDAVHPLFSGFLNVRQLLLAVGLALLVVGWARRHHKSGIYPGAATAKTSDLWLSKIQRFRHSFGG